MKIRPKYLPGSKWLYLRIYTGHKNADKILEEILYPRWKEIHNQGFSDTWFFIRYADPDFHLRFRVEVHHKPAFIELLANINHDLMEMIHSSLVWKTELGTYVPETERYGERSMKYAEEVFSSDSNAYIQLLNSGLLDKDINSRWLYALASAEYLLSDFKYSLADRKELLLQLNRNFGSEFGKDKNLAGQLSAKFRDHRQQINALLSTDNNNPLLFPLKDRSADSAPAIRNIFELHERDRMDVKRNDLLSSLIHMSLNRIFPNNNRQHEMLIYDLLFRYYKSQLMRDRS